MFEEYTGHNLDDLKRYWNKKLSFYSNVPVNLFNFIYGFWNDEIKRSQKELTENEYNTIFSEKLEQLMEIVDTEVQVFNVDKFFMDKLHDEIRELAENYKILNVR